MLDQQALVEGQLADPDVYADHARSSDLLKTFESCKQRSEAILEEMTTLEERMAAVRAPEAAHRHVQNPVPVRPRASSGLPSTSWVVGTVKVVLAARKGLVGGGQNRLGA